MGELPLAGVKVVEICQNVAGPYATSILAQLGAEVTKIERPGSGDDTRRWGPPFWQGESVMFDVMNAGKASRTIDLDSAQGQEHVKAMAVDADIVVASLRPGSLERRGLGPEQLRAVNPSLIYCSISGFGSRGPLAQAPGYDPLVQAFAGLMSLTGHEGQEPVRVGTSVIDMGTGMWIALAALAALRERDRTGVGSHVTSSLLETGLAWIPYQLVGYKATGEVPAKLGSGLAMLVPYQAFAAQDRHIIVAAGNDAQWQRLCAVLERPDLADDPRLLTNPGRVEHREHVVEEVGNTLSGRPAEVWIECLAAAGVPCQPVQSVDEVLQHPQTTALGMLPEVEHPDIEGFFGVALPFELDGRRPQPLGPPPPLSGT